MILKKERSLKNNLFTTKVAFVAYGRRDVQGVIDKAVAKEEEQIIDDFGAPIVSIGGYFGAVAKVDNKKVVLLEDGGRAKLYATPAELEDAVKSGLNPGEVAIEFVVNTNKVNLDSTFATSFTADANKLGHKATDDMTAEQIAEAQCVIFEEAIKARTEEVILEYKAKLTDFETGLIDSNSEEFEVPVI